MKTFHCVCALWALCAFTFASLAQEHRMVPSNQPGFQVDYLAMDRPIPKWENGYVLGFDNDPENAPLVYAFERSGAKVFRTQLSIDKVARFLPRDIAASRNGIIAISGGAFDAGGVGANVIAYLDPTGRLSQIVRLNEFAAYQLCFTRDGSLWAAGRGIDYQTGEFLSDHDIIRSYNDKGGFRGSFLRRTLFPSARHPVSGLSLITANSRKVVFYSAEGYLAELSYAGEVLSIKKAALPEGAFATGVAVSDADDIVISCQYRDAKQSHFSKLYLLDKKTDGLVEIYSRDSTDSNGYGKVFGFEGDDMLVGSFRPVLKFSWVRVSR